MQQDDKVLKDRVLKLEKIVTQLSQELALLRRSSSHIKESLNIVKHKVSKIN
jgi:hypothetical protein